MSRYFFIPISVDRVFRDIFVNLDLFKYIMKSSITNSYNKLKNKCILQK